jgi:hypothetical protein
MRTEPFDQRVSRAFAAIRAGDPLGMGQLYDLLGPRIYGLCRIITGQVSGSGVAPRDPIGVRR